MDDMIRSQNEAYFTLKISAVNQNSLFGSSTDALNIRCTYFINDDVNKTDPVDYTSATGIETMQGNTFALVMAGLVCIDHVKNNKRNCAMTLRKIKSMDIVRRLTEHFGNLIIEDFEYNDTYEQIVIPSKEADSVSKTLAFLNNKRVFYSTPYRFYQDFNATYLLSSSGNTVGGSSSGGGRTGLLGAGSMGSLFGGGNGDLNIQVSDIDDATTAISGMIMNLLSGLLGLGGSSGGGMGIGLNYGFVKVIDATIANKRKSKLRATSSDGTIDQELAVPSSILTNAPKTTRMNNDNEHMKDNIKAVEDSSNYFLSFTKPDLDTTAFVINKAITINNTQRYQELNGRYLLYRKRETYVRDADTFILTTMIDLRRIDSEGSINHKSGSGSFYSFK